MPPCYATLCAGRSSPKGQWVRRYQGCSTRKGQHDAQTKKNLTSLNYAEVLKEGKTCQKPRRNLARPRIRHGAYMSSTTCRQDFRDVPMNALVPAVQHTTSGTHCYYSEKCGAIQRLFGGYRRRTITGGRSCWRDASQFADVFFY